jgi:hypothetical protein
MFKAEATIARVVLGSIQEDCYAISEREQARPSYQSRYSGPVRSCRGPVPPLSYGETAATASPNRLPVRFMLLADIPIQPLMSAEKSL